jgi:hypothetical protein
LSIDLPAEVEARLERSARQQGKTKEEVMLDLLERMLPPLDDLDGLPRTGADLLTAWEADDALGAFQDEPTDFAQRLRETVWKRHL